MNNKIEVGTIIQETQTIFCDRTPWIFIIADVNEEQKTKLFFLRTPKNNPFLFKLDKHFILSISQIKRQIDDGEMRIIG